MLESMMDFLLEKVLVESSLVTALVLIAWGFERAERLKDKNKSAQDVTEGLHAIKQLLEIIRVELK